MTMCRRCGIRYSHEHGVCRTCGRLAGDTRTTREREADRIARRAAGITRIVETLPGAPRCLCIDGVEYEVAWDGTR